MDSTRGGDVIDASILLGWAKEEGFEPAGICDAQSPPHFDAYSNWLSKGYGASMEYLRRHLELKRNPETLLSGAKSILMVGLNYNQPNTARPGFARIARYALGRDYHKVVRQKLNRIGKRMSESEPNSNWRVCVDSAPLMERDFAQLAGLGWFGKNTMLINSERGSWFVLGALLTTIHLQPSNPAIGGCGNCRACIDACPTGAIVQDEGRWQVDSRRCISYLTIERRGEIEPELQSKMGEWTFGCDVCQEVCPFNQPRSNQPLRATPTTEADFKRIQSWPKLDQMEALSKEEWELLTQGRPVRRAGFEGLKRNARINLRQIERSIPESK